MKTIIEKFRKLWAWLVKTFTGKSFVLAFPFAVFLFGTIFAQSVLLFIAALIWLFPLILGIHEEES